MSALTDITAGRVRTVNSVGRTTFDSDEQMFYSSNIVTAQISVPGRVRAYNDPVTGPIEIINNIQVAAVEDGITFVQGAYKVTGTTATKPNGVWLNFGMTAFIYEGARFSDYGTAYHFLTPFISGGFLYVRDEWLSPSRPGSNATLYSGPYTVDMKMVLGGFN